ncbi:hypothetical protein RUM43_010474 [Polyplax serrata]|uniref:Odorant receptor n=1 Tax=Polyplax serrata TaxID=468196 RepID=A0AAN8PVU3_POLSC
MKKEDDTPVDVYSSHLNILRMMGLWRYSGKDSLKRRLYLTYTCSVVMCTMIILCLAMARLYIARNDVEEVSFNLSTNVLTGGIIVKCFFMVYSSKTVEKLFRWLHEDSLQNSDPEEVEAYENFKKSFVMLKKTVYFLSGLSLMVWLCFSFVTIIWEPRKLPFSLWAPVNLESDTNFYVLLISEVVVGLYVAVLSANTELTMFSIFFQTISQYRVLGLRFVQIKNFHDSIKNGKSNFRRDEEVNSKIKFLLEKCVRKHWTLQEYVRQIENVFNKPMVVQFGCIVVIIVMSGMALSVSNTKITMKWYCQIIYSMIIISDVFTVCYLATLLLEQEDRVFNAVCDLPWYEMNYDIRKRLITIMIGLQKKQVLTICKILKIDLTIFTWFVKVVTSWLTLLRQMIRS